MVRKTLCAVLVLMMLLCLALPVWGGDSGHSARSLAAGRSTMRVFNPLERYSPGRHSSAPFQHAPVRRLGPVRRLQRILRPLGTGAVPGPIPHLPSNNLTGRRRTAKVYVLALQRGSFF